MFCRCTRQPLAHCPANHAPARADSGPAHLKRIKTSDYYHYGGAAPRLACNGLRVPFFYMQQRAPSGETIIKLNFWGECEFPLQSASFWNFIGILRCVARSRRCRLCWVALRSLGAWCRKVHVETRRTTWNARLLAIYSHILLFILLLFVYFLLFYFRRCLHSFRVVCTETECLHITPQHEVSSEYIWMQRRKISTQIHRC